MHNTALTDSFLCPSIVDTHTLQHFNIKDLIWTKEVRGQVPPSSVAKGTEEESMKILTGLNEFLSPGILERSRARTGDNRGTPEMIRMIITEVLKMLILVKCSEVPGANRRMNLKEWNTGSTTSILMLSE